MLLLRTRFEHTRQSCIFPHATCLHELLEHMRRSLKLISVVPCTYPSHPHRWVTAQGSNSSFHHCSACGAARFDYKLKLATRLQLERRPLRCPHLHGRTAQRCVRAAMRSPWTDGTAFGVGVCRRRDLTLFVTYRQILPYWGCGYSACDQVPHGWVGIADRGRQD